MFALLDSGWVPPAETEKEPDLDTLLRGPVLSDALADIEKVEDHFEATPLDAGLERAPDALYRQIIETLSYAARKWGATASENRIGRDLTESFRDYGECLTVDPPNARMLNYIGQSITGVIEDKNLAASLDGFDQERIKVFLTENDNLIRGYFPLARRAPEFGTETDPAILSRELFPKLAAVQAITGHANRDGLFAPSVNTALEVLNRRAKGAEKVFQTTGDDSERATAIKELRRVSVLVTAFVGRIKGRLVQWLE